MDVDEPYFPSRAGISPERRAPSDCLHHQLVRLRRDSPHLLGRRLRQLRDPAVDQMAMPRESCCGRSRRHSRKRLASTAGPLARVGAQVEVTFSNSMIEAFWRSLKHSWLFLHALDNFAALARLVEFYVTAHNQVMPHSAFEGQTPDEMPSSQVAIKVCAARWALRFVRRLVRDRGHGHGHGHGHGLQHRRPCAAGWVHHAGRHRRASHDRAAGQDSQAFLTAGAGFGVAVRVQRRAHRSFPGLRYDR
jgi:hypothetical protein